MKILYLFRHAKSSWDDPALDDFERPLNKRGEKNAPLMGEVMRQRGVDPDTVLCSPARRTKQTAKLALKAAALKTEPVYDERLYLASTPVLLSVIGELDDDVSSALLVGHNPGLSDLLEFLSGTMDQFPTAALARVALDIQRWKDIKRRCGRLEWIVRPKELA
ncbi:MAG TPA: histidine phosphatase family protein [Candidatus Obscuribacterales bacterium]